jgi:hypothetical protein
VNRTTAIGAVIALILGGSCGKSESNSIVVVTVTAPPTTPVVTQLRAIVTNAGSSDTRLFPPGQPDTPIQFDTSFAVTFPTSRSGKLDIAVEALGSASRPVATGSGGVVIAAGGRADIIIYLALVAAGDGGVPDTNASSDGGTPLDAKFADGKSTPDVLQAGADVRDLAGGGGRSGTGGSPSSGGGGAGIVGSGGTGGASVVNPFVGGTTGSTGGIVSSGGVMSTGGLMGSGGAVSTGGVIGIDGGGGGEPCVPAKTITGSGSGTSGNFGTTGAFCFRTPDNITGWNCSNFTGRTLKVNGVTATCGTLPLPAKVNGYYYFDISAGGVDYSSIYWYWLGSPPSPDSGS